MQKILATLWLSCATSLFAAHCTGGSGGGGTPFIKIDPLSSVQFLGSEGVITDFAISPHSETLFYRSSDGSFASPKGGLTQRLPKSQFPFARVMDDEERFLFTTEQLFFLDLLWPHHYQSVPSITENFRLIFAKEGAFYGVEEKGDSFEIFSISPPFNNIERLGSVYSVDGFQPKLGRGHRFPSIMFFYTKDQGQHHNAWLLEMNVQTGEQIITRFEGEEPDDLIDFAGPVKSVLRFPETGSTGFIVDHPVRNFAWWELGTPCRSYSVGKALFPNDALPVLASWDEKVGLEIFNFDTPSKTRAVFSKELPIVAEKEEDLWITEGRAPVLYLKTKPKIGESGLIRIQMSR